VYLLTHFLRFISFLNYSDNDTITLTRIESQMIETERLQVEELRSQGMSDRQLGEMGYLQASIDRAPVAMRN